MIRMNARRRPGFTLVELMIAAAITVLIMTILSICFQTSMQAMSSMRAQGDAADQLRAVGEVMKRDFKADHFLPTEGGFQVSNRGRRLSDYDFRIFAPNVIGATAPTGFVVINSPASIFEGNDSVFDSFRGTGSIWFTCVLPGGTDGNLYTANVGGQVFSSDAAEVAYYLGGPLGAGTPAGSTAGTPNLPLYNLYRRQRLLASNSTIQGTLPTIDDEVISVSRPGLPPTWFVNTMGGVATGARPSAVGPTSIFNPLTGNRFGDDIVLSNVLSMEIKPTWQAPPSPTLVASPRGFGVNVLTPVNGSDTAYSPPANNVSSDAPYDTLSAFPASGSQFDTLFPTVNHPRIRVNGVQVRLRIYDQKVKTARQSTFIFDQ